MCKHCFTRRSFFFLALHYKLRLVHVDMAGICARIMLADELAGLPSVVGVSASCCSLLQLLCEGAQLRV